jgi:hypothetical protein
MRASMIAAVLAVVSVGCAAVPEVGEPGTGVAADELRQPRICPAIAILCMEGYRPKQLPNCRQTCVPDRGERECDSHDDCTIYCFTTPCPVGECRGHRCVAADPSPCAAVLCPEGTTCEARGGHAQCVANRCDAPLSWNASTGQCECNVIALCIQGWSWDPVACECISPCATVRCPAGTHCESNGPTACVPDDEPTCQRTGCSGQICAAESVFTTCEWRDEYACYADATCERQADGGCGWTATPELDACLAGSGI